MADHLTPEHHHWLTRPRLWDAYGRLLDLFARHRIEATFAFVMAFLLDPEEQRTHEPLFQDQPIDGRNWLANFRKAQDEDDLDGWSLPELLDLVRSHQRHEIGCHGFSHLPLHPGLVSREVMRHEIAAATTIATDKDLALRTFVYPRNLVGYPDELAAAGFRGFRDRLTVTSGAFGRAANLLAEFNVAAPPQAHSSPGGKDLIAIPAGHFFNWRVGLRRHVPRAVTRKRWTGMLDRAIERGGVVHLWLHPHNIISGPDTFYVLDDVLTAVAQRRDAGALEVQTQTRYCAALDAHHNQSGQHHEL